jgi:hypothetical protein
VTAEADGKTLSLQRGLGHAGPDSLPWLVLAHSGIANPIATGNRA